MDSRAELPLNRPIHLRATRRLGDPQGSTRVVNQNNRGVRRTINHMRFGLRGLALLVLAGLGGCGGPVLDATNVDTLESTFQEMIADMSELERERVAGAMLSVYEDSKRERVRTTHLPKDGRTGALFAPIFGRELLREIAVSSGNRLDGKTAGDLLAMQEGIAGRAARNQEAWEQERREAERIRMRERLEKQIAWLEGRLAQLGSRRQAAEEPELAEREKLNAELALLNGLRVKLESQASHIRDGWLRGTAKLTFENGTRETVWDAEYGYEYSYGECSGSRQLGTYLRLFKEPLEPGKEVTVEGQVGLGPVMSGVEDDESGQRCALSGANEYKIVGVKTAGIAIGRPSRIIGRATVERSLKALERKAKAREESEQALIQEIQTKKAALRDLE